MTEPAFDAATLERLRDSKEVDIETRSAVAEAHTATIWVVVDASERVLVRSWKGPGARWYREAVAAGNAALALDGTTVPVLVERATDPERIDACSRELLTKYGGGQTARSMVREEILDTTLELHPG
jgi:hypothetical protein